MKTKLILYFMVMTIVWLKAIKAQSAEGEAVPVTVDNFVRAESDLYLGNMVRNGSFGRFVHRREPASIDYQIGVQGNRDTLYSAAVFDLDASPVTITLPEAGGRFISMQVINEDHYVPVITYDAGSQIIDKAKAGTRYAAVAIRIVADPEDANDLKQAQRLQDSIKFEPEDAGKFEVPNWDQASQKKVRDALLALGLTIPDLKQAFGAKDQVDPVRHLIGTALRWGANPKKDAIYFNFTPGKNDGTTLHKLVAKDVPVDSFWSLTINRPKYSVERNDEVIRSLSDINAKKNEDGSIVVQFGGCDGSLPNCLPITSGWSYTVRLYRPRKEILDGSWKFPAAQPLN